MISEIRVGAADMQDSIQGIQHAVAKTKDIALELRAIAQGTQTVVTKLSGESAATTRELWLELHALTQGGFTS